MGAAVPKILSISLLVQASKTASSSPAAKDASPGESMPDYLARMNGLLAQVEQEHKQVTHVST